MPDLVICPCQHCSGKIEFDPANLSDENNKIACPHCSLETILFVPPPVEAKMETILSVAPPPHRAPLPRKHSDQRARILAVSGAVVVVAIAGLWFMGHEQGLKIRQDIAEHPEKYEDASERQYRYSREAEAAMLEKCSNYVGFQRVAADSHYVITDTTKTNFLEDWIGRGTVTIDYVNKIGGIERTDLLFHCYVPLHEHHPSAYIDDSAMYERERKAKEAAEAFQRSLDSDVQPPSQ